MAVAIKSLNPDIHIIVRIIVLENTIISIVFYSTLSYSSGLLSEQSR
jgi:hypothetical protein